ncbi:carbohydrate esterase family 4 protein [Desarmillaria tabescens]|uniref:chitin deacetylase n=1 Tax=Armillaria tabescens TaxID=1929756 RepID=A0AA39JUI9_ARMTA|nr:carbohydrate esterase family 4 protein [Desarmillaria tabescens]KAK0449048.1 carbohydrate esterase family 4 protein [Desarmillaria tabescens]
MIFSLGVLLQGSRAADRSTEEGEAAITDMAEECTAYYYEPSASHISSFPPIWQPASILSGDTVAQAKWQSISGSIPNISGTPSGNFSNVTYTADDPDCWWTYHQCVEPKLQGIPPDIAVLPEPDTLAFGFDDGPNCSHNAFYDYLMDQDQKATMFYIGSNVMDWPLEAQRAIADGHEVCVHTWSHRYMTALESPDAFAELYYCKKLNLILLKMEAIKLVTGLTPKCWRPPFGDVDDRIRAIANALGLQTILWKYDSNDWKAGTGNVTTETVDANYQSLIDDANNGVFSTEGAIILTHELNNYTMATAMKWYPQLKAAFKYIVPVAVALNNTQPYVETDSTMPSFEQYISGETTTTDNSDSNSTTTTSSSSSTSSSASTSSGGTNKSGSVSTSASASGSNSAGQSSSKTNGASPVSPDMVSSFGAALAALGYLAVGAF